MGNSTTFSVSQQSSPSLRRKLQTADTFSTSATALVRVWAAAVRVSLSRVRTRQLLVSGWSARVRWAALDSQRESQRRKLKSCPPQSSTLRWATARDLRWNWKGSLSLRRNSQLLNSSRLRFLASISFSQSSFLSVRSTQPSSSASSSTTSNCSQSYMPQSAWMVWLRKWVTKLVRRGRVERQSVTATESTEQFTLPLEFRELNSPCTLSESTCPMLRKPYSSSLVSDSSRGFSSQSLSACWRKQALTLQSISALCVWRSGLAMTLQLLRSRRRTKREGVKTRRLAQGQKVKSGRQSRKSCPPLRLTRVSLPSASSMDYLRSARTWREWAWICCSTWDSFCQVCWRYWRWRCRQARLLACRYSVRLSSTSTLTLRCSSSITARFTFFLNWNFFSPASSTLSRTNTPTLSCPRSTSPKNSSRRRPRPLRPSRPHSASLPASLPSSTIRLESAMPGQWDVLGQTEVSSWVLNWARRASMGWASPSARVLSLSSFWEADLRKQKVWRQAATRSILTSSSPPSTYSTRCGRGFSLACLVVCKSSRSMQESLAARLRWKPTRVSAVAMARFSMSMKLTSSGSSTQRRVRGKNRRVLSPPSSRSSSTCTRSDTRNASGQSQILESAMGMKPALSSPHPTWNSPPEWSNSSFEISAQSERSVSLQKHQRLKLSESRSLASTCPIRSSPARTAELSRQRQQMRSAFTLTLRRPSRSGSSRTRPEKLQVDSKNWRLRAGSSIWETERSVDAASCLQRKTGQTMLRKSFQSPQLTPTTTSRISSCSTFASPLKPTRSPLLPEEFSGWRRGTKAWRRRCGRRRGGEGAWLQRKSSSMQQCCWGCRVNCVRCGFSRKQFCSTATCSKVLELTSQNSSLSDTCTACIGWSLTSCSLAWPIVTSCLLLPELKAQPTSLTTARKCAHPTSLLTPRPSPSATHPLRNTVAVTNFSRLSCRRPRQQPTFSSCLKLTCLSPWGSCSPDRASWARALELNSVAACAISEFMMMLLQRSPSPELTRNCGSAIISATELNRSMVADLPLLPRRLSVSPTDCPRLPSPSSASTDFRMRWNSAIWARKRDSTFSWMGSTVTSRKGSFASTDSTLLPASQSVSRLTVSREQSPMCAFQSERPRRSSVPGCATEGQAKGKSGVGGSLAYSGTGVPSRRRWAESCGRRRSNFISSTVSLRGSWKSSLLARERRGARRRRQYCGLRLSRLGSLMKSRTAVFSRRIFMLRMICLTSWRKKSMGLLSTSSGPLACAASSCRSPIASRKLSWKLRFGCRSSCRPSSTSSTLRVESSEQLGMTTRSCRAVPECRMQGLDSRQSRLIFSTFSVILRSSSSPFLKSSIDTCSDSSSLSVRSSTYFIRLRTGLRLDSPPSTFPRMLRKFIIFINPLLHPPYLTALYSFPPPTLARMELPWICGQVVRVAGREVRGGYFWVLGQQQVINMIAESGAKKELGRVNAGVLVAVYVPLIILTPFYCYHMAVKQGQEKPYPAATITSTACHYPQDIAFRYFMLIASSLLALIFFLIFRWTAAAVKQANYPRALPSSLYYLTQFSILLYGITIGTIDARGTGPLHSPCAVAFFLILIIAIIRVSLFLTDLRAYDTSVISKWSLRVKQLLAAYLLLLWLYCIVMLIAVSSEEELQGKGDKYVVIVEWNTVTMGLLWVLSFYPEWKRLALTLTAP